MVRVRYYCGVDGGTMRYKMVLFGSMGRCSRWNYIMHYGIVCFFVERDHILLVYRKNVPHTHTTTHTHTHPFVHAHVHAHTHTLRLCWAGGRR